LGLQNLLDFDSVQKFEFVRISDILVIEGRFNKLENEHNLAMSGKLKIKH